MIERLKQILCHHRWQTRRTPGFFRLTDENEGPSSVVTETCIRCGKRRQFFEKGAPL